MTRIKRAAEELFVPYAFYNWDRYNLVYNEPMKLWGDGLKNSWWGYLRIVDCGGNVIASKQQLTGFHYIEAVRDAMVNALMKLRIDIPVNLVAGA